MHPEDPLHQPNSSPYYLHDEVEGETEEERALQEPAQPLTETQFHRRAQLVAQGLLTELAYESGQVKPGTDSVRVERALSMARQVIDSIRKSRATMQRAHEDQQFEQAVIKAAGALPKEHQTLFLSALEEALSHAEHYHS